MMQGVSKKVILLQSILEFVVENSSKTILT